MLHDEAVQQARVARHPPPRLGEARAPARRGPRRLARGARGRRRVVALEQARLEQLLELRRSALAAARGAAGLDRRPPERLLRRGGGAPKLSLNTSTSMVTVGPPSEAEPSSRSSIVFASNTSRPPIVWRAERGIVLTYGWLREP